MPKTHPISIQIVTGDARPIFRQIVDGIRMDIACGNLPVGSKLPSVRGLALQLVINPNTVAKAYSELTSQGLVESRQGLGLFVAQPRQLLNQTEQDKQLNDAIETFINDIAYLDFEQDQVLHKVSQAINRITKKQADGG